MATTNLASPEPGLLGSRSRDRLVLERREGIAKGKISAALAVLVTVTMDASTKRDWQPERGDRKEVNAFFICDLPYK